MSKTICKVLVCTRGKKCPKRGSEELAQSLRKEVDRQGLGERIKVKDSDCLKLCKTGPSVMVMPDEVCYGNVSSLDCQEIISCHAEGDDSSVNRLAVKNRKKKKKKKR
jgi:(2Fe-2S) ferredoxin